MLIHGGSAATTSGLCSASGRRELERDALVELHVVRRDDDAHAALAEHALDRRYFPARTCPGVMPAGPGDDMRAQG